MLEQDLSWMQLAYELASQAQAQGEVPVGAVLVADNQLLATGFNQVISTHDPSAHAEMVALRAAGLVRQNYRLPYTTLYVTLEPCVMCAGALIHARVERVVFGAFDPKTGAAGSVFQLIPNEAHNHRISVQGGLMQEQCAAQLQAFFRERRLIQKGKRDAS
ncbi:tRNA adenosine(34) deaminase TadA [Thiofilum flexile]|uniref:tRNA adenosine(34) deaminase TadA n=1 Tax=Thiofilum flexile TaxID=125627 RepID=UPI000369ECEC|nr:tRNA adenosine(34) deaminase TadA [Thiofilum flexile]